MITAELSAGDLLQMLEQSATSSAQERALHVLRIAYPEQDWESLFKMSIGRRDQALLHLRQQIFGERLTVTGECPRCREAVELALDTRELAAAATSAEMTADAATHRLEHGGIVIEFRLPNSSDLEMVAGHEDSESARRALLDWCVLSAIASDGSPSAGSELSGETQDALEAAMERLDPLAIAQFALACPSCEHRWQARLDIAEIVVAEFATEARSLMREVAALARHYHWSEQSILAMSSQRRRGYLDLAGA